MLPHDRLAIIDTAVEEAKAARRLLGEAAEALTASYNRLDAAFADHDSSGRIHATGSLYVASSATRRVRVSADHALYCLGRFRDEVPAAGAT